MEYKCLKKVTEAVLMWDTEHQITDRIYTDRIREVSDDETESDDGNLFPHQTPAMQRILDVLAREETWDATVGAYVCPVATCERQFVKLHHLNQHLASQFHRTDPSTFRCPKCASRFSVVSALIQHLESESCGLAGQAQVKQIYTGLHDMFSRLLSF